MIGGLLDDIRMQLALKYGLEGLESKLAKIFG